MFDATESVGMLTMSMASSPQFGGAAGLEMIKEHLLKYATGGHPRFALGLHILGAGLAALVMWRTPSTDPKNAAAAKQLTGFRQVATVATILSGIALGAGVLTGKLRPGSGPLGAFLPSEIAKWLTVAAVAALPALILMYSGVRNTTFTSKAAAGLVSLLVLLVSVNTLAVGVKA